ncbi:hypothetical protein [Natroniella sp. ANB-PHB2]|uniref:hypothetical protein n=1 Tax=Natroniella sp. ANB-PHB2 TaxID=3384444 RepID=UPI0038D3F274
MKLKEFNNNIEVGGIGNKVENLIQETYVDTKKFDDEIEDIINDLNHFIQNGLEEFLEKDGNAICFEKGIHILRSQLKKPNILDLVQQKIVQMKANERKSILGFNMRMKDLLSFLILLSVCNRDYSIEKENELYKILSILDEKTMKFLLYNLTISEQEHIKKVGTKVLKHLLFSDYRPKKREKILICGTNVPKCTNNCEKPKELFPKVIDDFTNIKENYPDFFNGLQKSPNLICGNCLSKLPKYERGKKILKGIDQHG